jgi:hypothetical protein
LQLSRRRRFPLRALRRSWGPRQRRSRRSTHPARGQAPPRDRRDAARCCPGNGGTPRSSRYRTKGVTLHHERRVRRAIKGLRTRPFIAFDLSEPTDMAAILAAAALHVLRLHAVHLLTGERGPLPRASEPRRRAKTPRRHGQKNYPLAGKKRDMLDSASARDLRRADGTRPGEAPTPLAPPSASPGI